jgi:hypothetical protein
LVQAASGQRFELVEPSGQVSATADVQRGRLLLYESTSQRVYFSREARYDSADGRYLGYFNFERNRVLRFPRSGTGVMQIADLDDVVPRFRSTLQVVRPVGPATGGAIVGSWPSTLPGQIGPPYVGPSIYGYRSGPPLAQSILIDSKTIPNPPLPPARVLLHNDGPRELQVGVVDLKNPSGTRSMRIQPAASAEVELVRDAGGKRIDHYRVITPYGESITKEFVTEIPVTSRYEVVVHEWAMQSVAIDRTGKSPNPIEDINFQGRGIGRFILPPGPQLQSGVIDVDRAARSQGNAGAVAPIVPGANLPSGNASRLEQAVLEAQRAAQQRARGK